jgi:SOS-response transcriptional repressor LexA
VNLRYDLLDTIGAFHATHHYAPSIRELQGLLGVRSMSTIHRTLVSLRDEGLVEWDERRYRTIRLASKA